MSIGEFFSVKKAILRFQLETIRLYYLKNWRFGLADFALGCASLFFNPYRICRKKGGVYGETPASSFEKIAAVCNLSPSDCWLELGAGRGRGCFWMEAFIGCRTVGIENISLFVRLARATQRLSRWKKSSFIQGEMGDADFSQATCVYLYSTCMSEEELAFLVDRMGALPKGAKVVSVSAPLPKSSHLHLADSFPLSFPWGVTDGFLHIIK